MAFRCQPFPVILYLTGCLFAWGMVAGVAAFFSPGTLSLDAGENLSMKRVGKDAVKTGCLCT